MTTKRAQWLLAQATQDAKTPGDNFCLAKPGVFRGKCVKSLAKSGEHHD